MPNEWNPPAQAGYKTGGKWLAAGVGLLLGIYFFMAIGAAQHKGPSFDEPAQLAAGYNNWRRHDFSQMGANGDFLKRWATLPYLITRPNLVPESDSATQAQTAYELGYQFFFLSGNQPEWLLLQSRFMVTLLGLALGGLIFACARSIAGPVSGLTALFIFIFNPNMLAFGAMVTPEVPMSLATLGATWYFWRLLNRASWRYLAGSLGFTILLVMTRPSAMALFLVAAMLAVVKLLSNHPLDWRLGGHRLIGSRPRQAMLFAGLLMLHMGVAWAAIWTNYEFRFAATPVAAPARLQEAPSLPPGRPETGLLSWAETTRFLPEGYIAGARAYFGTNDVRQTFLDGDWNPQGWRGFFLRALWEKNSPMLVVIFAIGLWGWISSLTSQWHRRRHATLEPAEANIINHYEAVPLLVLMLAYLLFTNLSLFSQRSQLPVLPALQILGGAGAAWVWANRAKWVRAFIVVLLLWRMGEAVAIYPNFLAYFNPFVGGPDSGYQHLVDKSLDWGMDLPGLKAFLDRADPHHTQPVYLAYFGTDNPEHYGIQARLLPGFPDWGKHAYYSLQPGYYAISATLHQTLYTSAFGPWNAGYEAQYQECLRRLREFDLTADNPHARHELLEHHSAGYYENVYRIFEQLRLARLSSWLRHHKPPDASAGYSILIWKLNADELAAALTAPPAELAAHPL
ncbi:MAG TPA: glycosyltransferase family 39 protein [Opitutales bacterium]|nr:glycosyltransferase family 39 protein [Opitutales bacterium]